MGELFSRLDDLVASFMEGVFQSIGDFVNDFLSNGGKGAYICLLLIGFFVAVVLLVGLFNMCKKFGLFLIIAIITIGIPCVWFFLVK